MRMAVIRRFSMFSTAVLLATLGGLIVSLSASAQSSTHNEDASALGSEYEFGRSPCQGQWGHKETGVCTHTDSVESGEGDLVEDGLEIYDLDYLLEVASGSSSGYCNNSTDYKVRPVYVTTKNRIDRYKELADTLRDKAERADYWLWRSAKQVDASRHFRYLCNSSGAIIIRKAILPNTADDSWSAMNKALDAAGYNDTTRKDLVFADWRQGGSDKLCGLAHLRADDSPTQTNGNNSGDMTAAIYLRAEYCKNGWAKFVMHELGHVMGGVQSSAPRHDDKNVGHPRDEHDVLAYGGNTYVAANCRDSYHEKRYDCNKNDYFNPKPAIGSYLDLKWNAARNRFLVGSGG